MKRHQSPPLPTFSFGNYTVCSYCGDPPTGRDHVISVCFQRTHYQERFNANGPYTPACQRCNSHLGANWFDSFHERSQYANECVQRLGRATEWGKRELSQLDYGLREMVKQKRFERAWLIDRANWFGSRDYWLNLENLQWRLESDQTSNPGVCFLNEYFRPTLAMLKTEVYCR